MNGSKSISGFELSSRPAISAARNPAPPLASDAADHFADRGAIRRGGTTTIGAFEISWPWSSDSRVGVCHGATQVLHREASGSKLMSQFKLVSVDRPEVPPFPLSTRLRSQLVYFMTLD